MSKRSLDQIATKGVKVMKRGVAVLGLLVCICLPTLLTAGSAAASDNYGSWSWPSDFYPVGWPQECLYAGTTLLAASPFKHNVSSQNACNSTVQVDVILVEYTSNGNVANQCLTGYQNNYAECQLDVSTPSGDYWAWEVDTPVNGVMWGFECYGSQTDFAMCWQQGDGQTV
jgi:hypothetical protein